MKPPEKSFLIGQKGATPHDFVQITLRSSDPDLRESRIVVQMGQGRLAQGPVLPPREILNFRMGASQHEVVDGKLLRTGWKEEPPGWFVRICEEAGCAWFPPIIARLADNEDVKIEEIRSAYQIHNNGDNMLEG